MHTIIVSDLHLGSRHSRVEPFLRLLDGLAPDADLVLNGDIVDRWRGALQGKHLEVQERLKEESWKRKVVWVKGNHDEQYALDDPANIEFADSYGIGKRLYVSHGNTFDTVMPYHQTFIHIFHFFHRLRIRFGAEAVHVAYYAKKFGILYGVLKKHVAMNAVEYARENGFAAVTCGHTHYAEDVTIDGIRYINTGAWTEPPDYHVKVTDTDITLRKTGLDDA